MGQTRLRSVGIPIGNQARAASLTGYGVGAVDSYNNAINRGENGAALGTAKALTFDYQKQRQNPYAILTATGSYDVPGGINGLGEGATDWMDILDNAVGQIGGGIGRWIGGGSGPQTVVNQAPAAPAAAATPGWLIPAAIGGLGLVAVLLFMKK